MVTDLPQAVTCHVQTVSDLLEQLVASLLASSTLLQDDNCTHVKTHKLLQVCKQVVTNLFTSCVRTT